MSVKRTDQDEGQNATGSAANLPTMSHFLRTADEAGKAAEAEKKPEEQMSMFWRVFGGTILSICALVSVTVFNNISGSITELRSELNKAQDARARLAEDLRKEIAQTKEGRGEYAKKEELQAHKTSVWERISTIQSQGNTHTTALTAQKTEFDAFKEKVNKSAGDVEAAKKEFGTALEASRKDSAACLDALKKDLSMTMDAMKKDVASLEVVKERLAALSADLKAAQSDFAKIRQDIDKNQAYDIERKETRDSQYKRIDESIKEMQRSVQECREKMARLEGSGTSVTPTSATEPKPNKKVPVEAVPTTNPRPAPVDPPGSPKPGPEAPDSLEPSGEPKPAPESPASGASPAGTPDSPTSQGSR